MLRTSPAAKELTHSLGPKPGRGRSLRESEQFLCYATCGKQTGTVREDHEFEGGTKAEAEQYVQGLLKGKVCCQGDTGEKAKLQTKDSGNDGNSGNKELKGPKSHFLEVTRM
ncbi:hypothetical protein ACOMHN_058875 [Nucella lapillus]